MSKALSPAGLTLTQARRVVWPFNRNRGLAGRTIGELLEDGQLTRRYLEWAAANARSLGLQNACRAILGEAEALSTAKGQPGRRTGVQPGHAVCEKVPVAVLDDEPERGKTVALILEPSDVGPEPSPPIR